MLKYRHLEIARGRFSVRAEGAVRLVSKFDPIWRGGYMKPIMSIEFKGTAGAHNFAEESVALHSLEELFAFVAPGGGCEAIPNEVDEIQIVFLPPEHPNTRNPIADRLATLELGMIYLTGPLAEIGQVIELLIDRAGRGELSEVFLQVTAMKS